MFRVFYLANGVRYSAGVYRRATAVRMCYALRAGGHAWLETVKA